MGELEHLPFGIVDVTPGRTHAAGLVCRGHGIADIVGFHADKNGLPQRENSLCEKLIGWPEFLPQGCAL
jgi:hypothetical protein